MTLLKHPTSGTIINVTDRRATVLKHRGYTEAAPEDLSTEAGPPSAVQPQPPIDSRTTPPEPPTDTRPPEMQPDDPIDMRPPNPLPVPETVADADDASLDASNDELPAKSATKDEWVAYAESQGLDDADSFTKAELIERYGD